MREVVIKRIAKLRRGQKMFSTAYRTDYLTGQMPLFNEDLAALCYNKLFRQSINTRKSIITRIPRIISRKLRGSGVGTQSIWFVLLD